MAARAPRLVAGRYELGRRLGAGGMAEVFLARDRATGRDVALKLLSPGLTGDPKLVERFAAEARAAAAIDHPNVVAVRAWGEDHIAMEYVPGPNLKELLRERGPLPEDEALALAAQVAAGLEAAHARGVVHLDVKPHNVLLAPDGTAKVTDFGIARALGGTGATLTTVIGSAPYLSPEHARGGRVDARADVYSLGALLYELLTGRPPFEGDAPLQVALRHLNEIPTPPRQLRPELSPAAEAVVLRALAKEPADRFASAAEMGRVIEDARLGIAPGLALAATQPLPAVEATRPLPRELTPAPKHRAGPAAAAAGWAGAAPTGASAAGAGRWADAAGGVEPPTARGVVPRAWAGAALAALLGVALLAFASRQGPDPAPTPRPTATAPATPKPAATAPAAAKPAPSATPPPTATRPPASPTTAPPTPTPPPTATPPPAKAPAVREKEKSDEERKPKKDKDRDKDDDDDD